MEGQELPSFHDVLIDTLNHLELLKWLHSAQILKTCGGSSCKRKMELKLPNGTLVAFEMVERGVESELALECNLAEKFHTEEERKLGGNSAMMLGRQTNEMAARGKKDNINSKESRISKGKRAVERESTCSELNATHTGCNCLSQLNKNDLIEPGHKDRIKGNGNEIKIILLGKERCAKENQGLPSESRKTNMELCRSRSEEGRATANLKADLSDTEGRKPQTVSVIREERPEGEIQVSHSNDPLPRGTSGKTISEDLENCKKAQFPDETRDIQNDLSLTQGQCQHAVSVDMGLLSWSKKQETNNLRNKLHVIVTSNTEMGKTDHNISVTKAEDSENKLNELGRKELYDPEGCPSNMQERTTDQLVPSPNNPEDIHGRVENNNELFLLNNIRSMENTVLTMKSSMLKDEVEQLLKAEGEQLCVPKKNSDSDMETVFKLEALKKAVAAEAKERERLQSQKAALQKCLAYALNQAEEGIFMCNCCKEIVHFIEEHTGCQNQGFQNPQSKVAEMNELQSLEVIDPCEDDDSCRQDQAFLYAKRSVEMLLESKKVENIPDGKKETNLSNAATGIHLEPKRRGFSQEENEDVQGNNEKRIRCQSISLDKKEKILNGEKETDIQDFFAWSMQKILEMEMCESTVPDNGVTEDKGEQYDSLHVVDEDCTASGSAQYYIGATKDKGELYESLHVVEKDRKAMDSVLMLELESDTDDEDVLK